MGGGEEKRKRDMTGTSTPDKELKLAVGFFPLSSFFFFQKSHPHTHTKKGAVFNASLCWQEGLLYYVVLMWCT